VSHLHHKVSALIDGELQGGARRRALAHAASCEDCQRELEQTYALKQRLLGLAAAEPPADLFAALGSVRSAPRTAAPAAGSRVAVVTRRAMVGAGSVSLAVVTLAYLVGGSESPTATVEPPVQEFSAEFADSTGLAAFSDPAVEVLSGDQRASAGGPLAMANAFASIGGAAAQPAAEGDDPRAVDHLVENHDVIPRLHQLHVVVVGARDHRRPRVEADDAALRERPLFGVVVLAAPIGGEDVEVTTVESAEEALALLDDTRFDCIVLDLKLPKASGFTLLERVKTDDTHRNVPVIIHTGKALTRREETRLKRYAESIVVKDAGSPERLLDETTLALHRPPESLGADGRRMLEQMRAALLAAAPACGA